MKRFDRTSNSQKLHEEIADVQSGVEVTISRDYVEYDERPFTSEIQTAIDNVINTHNPNSRTDEQTQDDSDKSVIQAFLDLVFDGSNVAHIEIMAVAFKAFINSS